MDPDVIDLASSPDDGRDPLEVTETVRSATPRWLVMVLVLAAVAVLAGLVFSGGDDAEPEAAPTPTTPSVAPGPTSLPAVPGPAEDDDVSAGPNPTQVATGQVAGTEALQMVMATRQEQVRFWSVDLAGGTAQEIETLLGFDPTAVVDAAFHGTTRATALLASGDYMALSLDAEAGTVTAIHQTDLGTRITFGLDTVDPLGATTWVGIPTGLIRWSLTDDVVDVRWIDNFGDRTTLPIPRAVIDDGLVVEAGGRSFVVIDGDAEPLDVAGEVVAGVADWIVTRRCDDDLRCGVLQFTNLGTGGELELDSTYRFRTTCGLVAPAADGVSLHVALQELGSLVLLTIAPDGSFTETELHPVGLGCVDAVDSGDGTVIVAHDRGLTVVAGGEAQTIQFENLRPIVAASASMSDRASPSEG